MTAASFHCGKCGAKREGEKPDFRAICPACGAYLHACINCTFYDTRSHHECRASATAEFVADKEKFNFCEEFRYRPGSAQRSSAQKSREEIEKLFPDLP